MAIYSYISKNLKIIKLNDLNPEELLSDTGLLYGFGIFETILVKNSIPVLLEDHLSRMQASSKKLKFQQFPSKTNITKEIFNLISINKIEESTLNIYLTGGTNNKNNIYIIARSLNKEYINKKYID